MVIIRPHRSTTYIDAANCYRPNSVVCRSVCLSVTVASPAKTAELIEMPFGLYIFNFIRRNKNDSSKTIIKRKNKQNNINQNKQTILGLDGLKEPMYFQMGSTCEWAILRGKGAAHCKV